MKRAEITARLPFVLGLDRLEAAASVGISATMFDALVDAGVILQRLQSRGSRGTERARNCQTADQDGCQT